MNDRRTNARRTRRPPPEFTLHEDAPKIRQRGGTRFIITAQKLRFLVPWRRLIIALGLVFFGALGSTMTHAHIASTQNMVRAAQRELRDYQTTNFTLESQIGERYTFEEIERIAIERLGMSHPDTSQVISISVARQSTVVLNRHEHILPTEENFFWQDLTGFFRNMLDRFFGGDS